MQPHTPPTPHIHTLTVPPPTHLQLQYFIFHGRQPPAVTRVERHRYHPLDRLQSCVIEASALFEHNHRLFEDERELVAVAFGHKFDGCGGGGEGGGVKVRGEREEELGRGEGREGEGGSG